MYSLSLSRFSFFTKTKRHIKTFHAVVIPYTVFVRQPSPLPPERHASFQDVSPHAPVLSYPGGVPNPKAGVHKGGGGRMQRVWREAPWRAGWGH